MEISKDTFEAMLVLLYKLEHYEACEKLFEVYKELFFNISDKTVH